MRIFWTFGSQRRGVARMEWLLLLPKLGFLPQMVQTLDIVGSSLLDLPARESAIVCTRQAHADKPRERTKGDRPANAPAMVAEMR
jgi:hypothetical protein